MTKNTKSKNTKAEDSIEGGASEHAEAQHGAAIPAVRPEGAAPDVPSATDSASASGAGEGPLPEATSSVSPVSPAPSDLQAGGATKEAGLVVTCHSKGGRRRAGRRWEEGQTRVAAGELDEFQLSQLIGDPRFTVTPDLA